MYNVRMQKYKLDYVYAKDGTSDLQSVEIECNVINETLNFEMNSETEMSRQDIMNVINGIQKDTFNRIKINIIQECLVLYKYAGSVFKVVFDETGKAIIDLQSQ